MFTRSLPFLLSLALSTLAHAITVRVVVEVPAEMPASDSVFLAGSLPSVGGWKVDGVRLYRDTNSKTTFVGEIEADAGQTLEYKFNRGTWATVEKNADGTDRPNRSTTIAADTKVIEAKVLMWGEGSSSPSSVVGRLSMDNFYSPVLGGSRMLRVWLPPNYFTDPKAKFDVLYMHDGQNCFDASTSTIGKEWRLDETLTAMIKKGEVRPMVVVAIDHGGADRINDYTYDADNGRGGKGATYAKFLLDEVKPFVESNYRVKSGPEHTFIGGSSLGGVISLDIARRHPKTFGGVIAMSPALWWNGESLTKAVEKDADGLAGTRVWLDIGTKESAGAGPEKYVAAAKAMDKALQAAKIPAKLTVTEGGEHNEGAWAERFPDAIRYITAAPAK